MLSCVKVSASSRVGCLACSEACEGLAKLRWRYASTVVFDPNKWFVNLPRLSAKGRERRSLHERNIYLKRRILIHIFDEVLVSEHRVFNERREAGDRALDLLGQGH